MAAQRGFIPDEIAGGYTSLRKYHPVYAAGIAKPPMIIKVIEDFVHKACVQGLTITFNKKFLAGLSWADAMFILAHEVMHYMMKHGQLTYTYLMAGQISGYINNVMYTFPYEEVLWQHSLDKVINDGLRTNAGMTPPADAIIEAMPGDFNMSEADVYVRDYKKKLDEQKKQQQTNDQLKGRPMPGGNNGQPQPGQGRPSPLPGDPSLQTDGHVGNGSCQGNTQGMYPTNRLVSCGDLLGAVLPVNPAGVDEVQQQEIIRQFVEELAEKGQGNMAGMIDRLSEGLEKSPKDWRKVIRPKIISAVGKDVETWNRFNKRSLLVKSFRPALQGRCAGDVGIGMDTSGSIGGVEQRIMLNAVCDIYEQASPRRTYLWEIDTRIRRTTIFKNPREMREFIRVHVSGEEGLRGGGGSSGFPKVDPWLVEHNIHPHITIFFTDGFIRWPTNLGNSKRVVWVITNDYRTAPEEAGETIRFTMPN